MKLRRVIFLVFLVFFTTLSLSAASPFRIEPDRWDWGVIREGDGPVSHTFSLVNTSSKPVNICGVNVSCGCTRVSWSAVPVYPGKATEITVTFNPTGYKGRITKTLSVRSSTGSTDPLTVSCEVIPAERPLDVAFPVSGRGGLRLSADKLNLGQVRQGESRKMKIGLANSSSSHLSLSVSVSGGGGAFSVQPRLSLDPAARDSLLVTFTPRGLTPRYGFISAEVVLQSGGKVLGRFPVSGIGVERAREKPGGAVLRVDSQYRNLGSVSRSEEEVRSTFVISNIGNEPLILRDIHSPECIEVVPPALKVLPPGEKTELTFILHPSLAKGKKIFETVYLTSSDPAHPVREIMIAATIL